LIDSSHGEEEEDQGGVEEKDSNKDGEVASR